MADRRLAFLLAPGAGAPSSHPRMQTFAQLLAQIGPVEPFDYPYAKDRKRRPDPLPKLIAAHKAALKSLREKHDGPIVLVGKSMGGRVGCHVALSEPVAAVVCLGYPLCAAGDRSKLRDQVLLDLRTPAMFVQGTRDSLCPLELLDDVRKRMRAFSALHVVDGADHSLLISKTELKARGATQEDADAQTLAAIETYLGGLLLTGA
jgi:predicted alpha/beta-hydrolase family hydrolase